MLFLYEEYGREKHDRGNGSMKVEETACNDPTFDLIWCWWLNLFAAVKLLAPLAHSVVISGLISVTI